MDKKKFLIIAGSIMIAVIIFSLLIPIYLDDVGVERAFNNSYGKYNNLWLTDTYFDGINQEVIIKTPFNDIKEINEKQLIEVSKKFMMEIQKYDIPKEMEAIWIIFTNSQGHSINSVWTSREKIERVKWKKTTDSQFKNVMHFK